MYLSIMVSMLLHVSCCVPQAVRTSQAVLAKEKAAIVNDFAPDKKVRQHAGPACSLC